MCRKKISSRPVAGSKAINLLAKKKPTERTRIPSEILEECNTTEDAGKRKRFKKHSAVRIRTSLFRKRPREKCEV
jgi:hypothetical protein